MDRNLASGLALAATAAIAVTLAATTPGTAYADDITVDNTPFQGSRTRAEIRAELSIPAAVLKSGAGEWALQDNGVLPVKSGWTRDDARAEYKASRSYWGALNAEDGGSASSFKSPPSGGTATMGGPAR